VSWPAGGYAFVKGARARSWLVRDLQSFVSPTAWDDWRASKTARPIRGREMALRGSRAPAINDRRREGANEGGADAPRMSLEMACPGYACRRGRTARAPRPVRTEAGRFANWSALRC
jgi:hypothetical protein